MSETNEEPAGNLDNALSSLKKVQTEMRTASGGPMNAKDVFAQRYPDKNGGSLTNEGVKFEPAVGEHPPTLVQRIKRALRGE